MTTMTFGSCLVPMNDVTPTILNITGKTPEETEDRYIIIVLARELRDDGEEYPHFNHTTLTTEDPEGVYKASRVGIARALIKDGQTGIPEKWVESWLDGGAVYGGESHIFEVRVEDGEDDD